VYVTRIDTIITTLREYTALVKIGCLLGLRLQDELLRPSADADSDDEDDVNASAARAIKAEPSLLSNGDDTHAGPPALESVDDVARSTASAAPSVKKLPPIAPHLSRHLSHLDSSAWMGLPANYREFLSGTLNEHQLKAVQVALQRYDKPGFTLLQGPPGTGTKQHKDSAQRLRRFTPAISVPAAHVASSLLLLCLIRQNENNCCAAQRTPFGRLPTLLRPIDHSIDFSQRRPCRHTQAAHPRLRTQQHCGR
jgi:hypothetical protein